MMAKLAWLLSLMLLAPAQLACSTASEAQPPGGDAGLDAPVVDVVAQEADATEAEAAPMFVCGVAEDPGDVCQSCSIEQCCSEVEACAEDAACESYTTCASACEDGDWDCIDPCILEHPSGYAKSRVLNACLSHKCNEPCEALPEKICGASVTVEACQSCAVEKCCDSFYAAVSNTDLHERDACITACNVNDDDCINTCVAQHGEGHAKNGVLLTCLAIECTQECVGVFGEELPCGLWIKSPAACQACQEERCCEVVEQASYSEDVWRYSACRMGCDDAACIEQCRAEHIEGFAQDQLLAACNAMQCPDACNATGAPCGGMYYIDPYCDDCMVENCCDPMTASGTSLTTQMYRICSNACGMDSACKTQCMLSYPDGYVMEELTNVCKADYCEVGGICLAAASDNWICGAKFGVESVCGACIETSCCEETHACATDFDCHRIELCRHLNRCDNDDIACLDACKSANPLGAPLFDAALGCRSTACPTACANF